MGMTFQYLYYGVYDGKHQNCIGLRREYKMMENRNYSSIGSMRTN